MAGSHCPHKNRVQRWVARKAGLSKRPVRQPYNRRGWDRKTSTHGVNGATIATQPPESCSKPFSCDKCALTVQSPSKKPNQRLWRFFPKNHPHKRTSSQAQSEAVSGDERYFEPISVSPCQLCGAKQMCLARCPPKPVILIELKSSCAQPGARLCL